MASTPEEIRLRYLYRRLVLRGGVRLPMAAARSLVGPDCAFHLYATREDPEVELADGKGATPGRVDGHGSRLDPADGPGTRPDPADGPGTRPDPVDG